MRPWSEPEPNQVAWYEHVCAEIGYEEGLERCAYVARPVIEQMRTFVRGRGAEHGLDACVDGAVSIYDSRERFLHRNNVETAMPTGPVA